MEDKMLASKGSEGEDEGSEEGNDGNGEDESNEDSEEEVEEEVEEEDADDRVKDTQRLSKIMDWTGFYGYKCYFEKMITEGKEFMDKFDDRTRDILFKTPFGVFFQTIYEERLKSTMVRSCPASFVDIVGKFSGKGNEFNFGKKDTLVKLEEEDVALIFGIPLRGNKFDLSDKSKGYSGKFEKQYLGNAKRRFSKTELVNIIQGLLKKKKINEEEREDLVKLFLLYSFAQFFFCSTNCGVTKAMIRKCEKLSDINNCSWPSMIHTYLMSSLRENCMKPKGVSGCVYVLMYFMLEHCDLIKPIKGSQNSIPRLLKWDLSLVTGDKCVGFYEKIPTVKVVQKLEINSQEEKDIVGLSGRLNEAEDDDFVDTGDVGSQIVLKEASAKRTRIDTLADVALGVVPVRASAIGDGSSNPGYREVETNVYKRQKKKRRQDERYN